MGRAVRSGGGDALARGAIVKTFPRAWLLTLALATIWALSAPRTPDLAAQVYRTWLFSDHGFVVWDNAWYGGHHVPGYSLLFPPLASLLGLRLVGILAATGSALLFELTLRRLGTRWAGVASWVFAVGCLGDLLVGRLTYALGVTVGLGAIAALVRGHSRVAAALAVACAATSPVAGVFLSLVAVVLALATEQRRAPVVACAAILPVLAGAVVFPEGGTDPFSLTALAQLLVLTLGAAAVVNPEQRTLRLGLVLYAAVVVGSFLIASPLGGNVIRLGSGFLLPLVFLAGPSRVRHTRVAFAVVVAAVAFWQVGEALKEARKGIDDPSAARAYYRPLVAALRARGAADGRVEVPFTRNHWEAAYLARSVWLARGWERQLDRRLNPVFYRDHLTAAQYRAWLANNGVGFVALPDAPMDPAGLGEATLVTRGVPFLRQVWHSAHWRLFRTTAPNPLVSGPARVEQLGTTHVKILALSRGDVTVRLHWTPYWRVTAGAACASPGEDGWTHLQAARPGVIVLAARLSVSGLLGDTESRCP
jgi:hypothetical protein